jgi:hypothetical protein
MAVRREGIQRMVSDDGAPEWTRWDVLSQLQIEMDRCWGHARLRLQVIAAILAGMALLVAVGHARADAGALAVRFGGVGDLLAGYPSAIVLVVISFHLVRRSQIYRTRW